MQQTPLIGEYEAHGGKVVDFHGWALPVQFRHGIVQEHLHTRTKASLFDCSHMGEFLISGKDTIDAYHRLVMTDVLGIKPGRGRYGALLNEKGGIVDDIITFRLGEDDFFVVTNAGPLDVVAPQITACGPGATDISSETAKIDIQGPLSREILVLEMPEAANLKYFQAIRTHWKGSPVVLARTGYTGELGFEIFVPAAVAVPLWRALAGYDAVEPAGLGARDTLRTEVVYSLSGQDFNESRTPLEAGLDAYIAWDTEFTGKAALQQQRDAADYPVLTPVKTADRRAPRHDFEVTHNGDRVGVVTSGTYGPSVGYGIGLAYLPRHLAKPGTTLVAGPRELPIETATAPFYRQGTCRI